ncbi:MAG: glycosyltransferase family 39 protein [Chloroflexi bacterium]|nr:glycosyltransferase family 39 protein [Chloroflexota bacterium]
MRSPEVSVGSKCTVLRSNLHTGLSRSVDVQVPMVTHSSQGSMKTKKWYPGNFKGQALLLGLIPILIFILLAGHSLWLPGIYYDEVLQMVTAIAALKGGVNGPIIQVEGSVISLLGHPFPLLILPYLGATQAGILTLAFAIADMSVPVMRGTFIALGAIGLIFTFLFTRRLFGLGTALLSTLLLAVDPTYIFASRSDNGPTAVMMISKMAALWFLITWWQTRKFAYLLAGAFLCGFGLYDKVNFIWFLGALGASVIVFYSRELWERVKRVQWYVWLGALTSFCMGAAVLIAYTALTGGGPFRGLLNLTHQETAFGVDNSNLLDNLGIRLESLFGLLSGYEILDFYTSTFGGYQFPYSRGIFVSTALPWLVGLAILVCGVQAILRVKWLNLRKALFLLLMSALMVLASTVTPTNLMYHHLLLVYPFLHLFVAHFLMAIPNILKSVRPQGLEDRFNKMLGWGLSSAIIAIALAISLGVTTNYYRVLEETGGIGMWSDAIYELANHLEGDERTVVCMDWGINLNLIALSKGELHTLEPWQEFLYTGDYSPEMEALISKPDQVFVFHTPKYSGVYAITQEDFPRQSFFETVKAIGVTAVLEKTFTQRDGDTLFELYTVSNLDVEKERAANITDLPLPEHDSTSDE